MAWVQRIANCLMKVTSASWRCPLLAMTKWG